MELELKNFTKTLLGFGFYMAVIGLPVAYGKDPADAQVLLDAGLSETQIAKVLDTKLTVDKDRIEFAVQWLKAQGVKDPATAVADFPGILSFVRDDPRYASTLKWLEELGVKNIGKYLGEYPNILGLSIKTNLEPKVAWLKNHGVKNVGKLASAKPGIFSMSIEDTFEVKLAWLQQQGVTNTAKVISSMPSMMGYSIENNLNPKVEWLKAQGIKNVGKLLTNFPQIMGLSIENNLNPKMKEFQKWGISIEDLERSPELFGAKQMRIKALRLNIYRLKRLVNNRTFNIKDLPMDAKRHLIRGVKSEDIIERLRSVHAFTSDRTTFDNLTPGEKMNLKQLFETGAIRDLLSKHFPKRVNRIIEACPRLLALARGSN
ncbi:MAG TPA: hypothetical protein VM901_04320 [Bdellovibrionota bacterium]|nr:hypothetical protein [Bdellovibrionota bacterium]